MQPEITNLASIEERNEEIANTLRELIKHENDLINQRLTWLISLQGLLFAALGFAWGSQDAHKLIPVFCFLGVTTSISIGIALWGGARAIKRMSKFDARTLNTVIGRQAGWAERALYPWSLFPILFIISWVVVLIFNFQI